MLRKVVFHIFFFLIGLAFFSLLWVKNNYSLVTLDEIVFLLNMPMTGTPVEKIVDFVLKSLVPALLLTLVHVLICLKPFKGKRTYSIEFVFKKKHDFVLFPVRPFSFPHFVFLMMSLCFVFMLADKQLKISTYFESINDVSTFIEENYVDPTQVAIDFPKQKKNLVMIYVESCESSAQDYGNGGYFEENYIPEMTAIAKENISFSQSELIEGASVAPASGWTIAGLVAETAGLPLKLFSYDSWVDNSMEKYAQFLPGVTSLGDILLENGYHNYFMAGSDFNFGGRTTYFQQHGDYEIFDYFSAIEEGKIPEDYYEWWGFEDVKLYEYAKEKLLELAESDEPFNFSMLTADTHQENGYVCSECVDYTGDQYRNVWRCTSKQLNDFLEWMKTQSFYEDTVIVIMGDHCSMDADFYAEITAEKHYGSIKRKVYNAFINSAVEPVQENNRMFTTFDYFPSILGALGVTIEGNQLGLGVNLFSDEQTLSERYGYDHFFVEVHRKSVFYNEVLLYPDK
ncbi:MAG: LTA synthase family protein [Erysipelotrichaceae bacterium]|nr:LTA synthase family protein [Erysipelotrichaceae bacterium]